MIAHPGRSQGSDGNDGSEFVAANDDGQFPRADGNMCDMPDIRKMYLQRFRQWSPLMDVFLSKRNITYLKSEIEQTLTNYLNKQAGAQADSPINGSTKTLVPIDEDFFETLVDTLFYNPRWAYCPAEGLRVLNNVFIQRLLRLQYYSLRNRQYYRKMLIDQDRFWHSVHERGISDREWQTVRTDGYMLSHPWGGRQQQYFSQVYGMECPKHGGQLEPYYDPTQRPIPYGRA